ncbi:hypothetical protein ACPEEN_09295 [Pasteurella sp. PK-2025]|uniref:hypothetical protein n=1 Tax=unclassified Pasteurella TaxID=2621516 RepID=UPI003C796FBD
MAIDEEFQRQWEISRSAEGAKARNAYTPKPKKITIEDLLNGRYPSSKTRPLHYSPYEYYYDYDDSGEAYNPVEDNGTVYEYYMENDIDCEHYD